MTDDEIFVCTMCGDCCKGFGGTYVSDKDILAISKFIGEDPLIFREKYCVLSGGRPLLTQRRDGYCIFFDKKCTIHPVKPKMCRAWPFIKSVQKNPENWAHMASVCAGMKKDATIDQIRETLSDKFISLDN